MFGRFGTFILCLVGCDVFSVVMTSVRFWDDSVETRSRIWHTSFWAGWDEMFSELSVLHLSFPVLSGSGSWSSCGAHGLGPEAGTPNTQLDSTFPLHPQTKKAPFLIGPARSGFGTTGLQLSWPQLEHFLLLTRSAVFVLGVS